MMWWFVGSLCLCIVMVFLVGLVLRWRSSAVLSEVQRHLEQARMDTVHHQAHARLWEERFLAQQEERRQSLLEWKEKEAVYQAALLDKARIEEANHHCLERIAVLDKSLNEAQDNLARIQKDNTHMKTSLSIFVCEMNSLEKQKQDNQQWLLSAKEHFQTAFSDMAHQVLGKTSHELQRYHDDTLLTLLSPLRERLQTLEKTIQEAYHVEAKERFSLSKEIHLLAEKSHHMTQEAHALSTALRQNHKIQGAWGEMILENILESSGLRKGIDFWVQKSFVEGETQKRLQPDVVIRLPEDKHIVLDAKVSLVAFEQYVVSHGEGEQGQAAIKSHLQAVRQHIKTLSSKAYHEIADLKTAEFVLMFIPIESAFLLALSQDEHLFLEAWKHQVVIIGPSTLLATLRIVARVLSFQEYHDNAQKMMRYATQLYEKAVGFLEDMETLGARLDAAQKAYEHAAQRLKTGRGSVVHQIENIQKLGVHSRKSIPESLASVEGPELMS